MRYAEVVVALLWRFRSVCVDLYRLGVRCVVGFFVCLFVFCEPGQNFPETPPVPAVFVRPVTDPSGPGHLHENHPRHLEDVGLCPDRCSGHRASAPQKGG